MCRHDVITETALIAIETLFCIMASLVSLLVLLMGPVDLLAANSCDIYVAVGQDLELPFVYDQLDLSYVLRWTHNKSIVFYRQQSRVTVGNASDLSRTGSLKLRDLQFSSSGDYQVDVLDRNNTPAVRWLRRLCVLEWAPKPQLTSFCDFPTSTLQLNCQVAKPQAVEFSWAIDGKILTSEKKQKLSVSLAKIKASTSFTCKAANAVSWVNSDIVRHSCTMSTATQTGNYCFRLQTVQATFAGGAGLLLLLLAIIITLCCCRRQRQRPQEAKDGEAFRMRNARNVREAAAVVPEYEVMLSPAKPQGQSSEQDYYLPVPQAEDKPTNRHHPAAEEAERSSPVPKPRTKSPQMAKV